MNNYYKAFKLWKWYMNEIKTIPPPEKFKTIEEWYHNLTYKQKLAINCAFYYGVKEPKPNDNLELMANKEVIGGIEQSTYNITDEEVFINSKTTLVRIFQKMIINEIHNVFPIVIKISPEKRDELISVLRKHSFFRFYYDNIKKGEIRIMNEKDKEKVLKIAKIWKLDSYILFESL